ncbi:MAG: dihydropteroate synthase [Candidatus Eremiobacteraeota bacterium]|nr:dihydropteroate synthase [Candidatus Eremiobacteraeota bacterium]
MTVHVAVADAPLWRIRDCTLALARPFVVGVLNVTPDSFSDGGRYDDLARAVARADALVSEGADMLDVGGESTRPHNLGGITAIEERARVVPVIAAIRRAHPSLSISVDTVKADVARAALDAGADVVNDVSALRLDPALGAVCAEWGAGVVLMHSRGSVADMATYAHASYRDVVGEVAAELRDALGRADAAGIPREAIVLDPGVGFAKRTADSVAVLAGLPQLAALGRPLLVGASRKRFVGELSGVADPELRVSGSVGAHVAALARGARLFRVHDVRAHREALDVAWAVLQRA